MKINRPVMGVLLVFLLGIISGALATHLLYQYRMETIISGRAQPREEAIVGRLHRKLDLDDRQEEQVRLIIHESHKEMKALRQQFRPQTEAIIEKAQARIAALLTPEQLKKYESMIVERKEKFGRRRR